MRECHTENDNFGFVIEKHKLYKKVTYLSHEQCKKVLVYGCIWHYKLYIQSCKRPAVSLSEADKFSLEHPFCHNNCLNFMNST